VRAFLLRIKEYERLTVKASMKGSYGVALAALEENPLVSPPLVACQGLDEFVEAFGGMMGWKGQPCCKGRSNT
jgi:alpha-galactosidase/6-phospho-beta-glucosidase family protein